MYKIIQTLYLKCAQTEKLTIIIKLLSIFSCNCTNILLISQCLEYTEDRMQLHNRLNIFPSFN